MMIRLSAPVHGSILTLALATALQAAPVIDSFSGNAPTIGGSAITLTGSGFGSPFASALTINFGDMTLAPTSRVATEVIFTLPAMPSPPSSTSNIPLSVTFLGETSSELSFNYNAPAITSVTPSASITSAGGSIVIDGSNFGSAAPKVYFGGVEGAVTASSHASITVTKPLLPAGSAGVVVQQSGAASSSPAAFTSLGSLPGYYIDTNSNQVLPAPAGRYTDTPNATATLPAPAGTYAPVAGLQAAIDTPAGSFNSTSGNTEPTPAPVGRYAPQSGLSTTSAAPAGTYAPVTGLQAAIPTPPGYFNSTQGNINPTAADAGYYVDSFGASSQSEASAGFYTPVAGMRQTIAASPGYLIDSNGATSQEPTPAGTYSPSPGSTAGQSAPLGTYAPVAGLQAAIQTPPGYFNSTQGNTEPTPAPVGRYVPQSGLSTTFAATAGSYAPILGLRAPIPAPDGTYAPGNGLSTTAPVPAGFTRNEDGTGIIEIPQLTITAYTLEVNGDNTLSFETTAGQTYGIFYTENLNDYTLLQFVPGTGGVVTRTFSPPVSSTGKRFYVVGPASAP